MKIRAISIIDMEIEGGFREAADIEDSLNAAIKKFCDSNKDVVTYQTEVRDRRGDKGVDISKMKFRSN
jgi:hypothetical protein